MKDDPADWWKGKDGPRESEEQKVYFALEYLPPLYFHNKRWYCYNEKEGRYAPRPDEIIAKMIDDIFENPTVRLITAIKTHISWKIASEIPLRTAVTESEEGTILINVQNGVVEVFPDGWHRLISHDKDYKFSKVLPVDYLKEGFRWEEVCPIFSQVLQNQLPLVEDQDLFLLTCANSLIPYRKFEVCVVAIGEGGTGKTTLYDTISEVFGDCKTSLTLSEICRDSQSAYGLPSLWNSMLNIGSEVDARELDSTNWKRIISNETFTGRAIYGSPEERRSYSKLFFLCNMLPKFRDGSTAEMRRIRFIPFDVQVAPENRNTWIFEALKSERNGIFMLLLKRLGQLLSMTEIPHGSFVAQKTERIFRAKNDPIVIFHDECLECGEDYYVYSSLMGERVRRFLTDHDMMESYKPEAFKRNVCAKFKLEYDKRTINGKQHRIISGCRIKEEKQT